MPAGRVLLFWSIIKYLRSIIFYVDRHVILSYLYIIWTVDHNWPTVDLELPCLCTTSQSIIIYHPSILIYLDRHVDFSFRYTLRTVDHNWPTVDHAWAWSCTTSWSIIICHIKLKLSEQTSSTFHLMGSLISNHFLYIVYKSCDFFLIGIQLFS